MENDGTEEYENSLIDLTEDTWLTPAIEDSLAIFLEELWSEDAGLSKVEIKVSHLPGDPITINTEFGTVEFKGDEE